MTYQLIALDMDGTLLGKNKEISEENYIAVKMALEAGKKVVLATGRPIRDVLPYAEQLNLNMPLVINNGSEIWKNRAELHKRHELSPELIRRILDLISNFKEVSYWAHTVAGTFTSVNAAGDLDAVQWLQFAVHTPDSGRLEEINRELQTWGSFEISNSHPTNLECNALSISKASGLQEVCAMLDVPMSEAIAVGDSLNDIPMIRKAGLGVAMGNAQIQVKQAADAITLPNTENGVAKVIHQYLLA